MQALVRGKIHYAWLIMVSCCFVLAGINGVYAYCAGIFFRPVALELGVGQGEISLYYTFQALASALAMPLVNLLLRKIDLRLLITTSALIGALMFGLMSTFTAAYQWYVAGSILGLCCGYIFIFPVPIIINNWFKKKAGFALGIATLCAGLGGAALSPLGILIITRYSWRMAYIVLALSSLCLVLPFSVFVLRLRPADLSLKPYGMGEEPGDKISPPEPLEIGLPATAFESSTYLLLVLACGCIALVGVFVYHIPSFIEFLGYDASLIAALSSCMMLGTVGAKPFLGWLIDGIGAKDATLFALGALFLSFMLLVFFNHLPIMLFIALLLYGFAPALVTVAKPQLVKELFGSKDFTSLYTYIAMIGMLIGAVGVAGIGFLFDAFNTYTPAFIIAGISCLFALGATVSAFSQALNTVDRISGTIR